jgi:hypothetical protein
MKRTKALSNKLCYETVIVNGINTQIPIEILI